MLPNDPSKSLDFFFASDDQVMVIRGAWGVGKTYLWEKYIGDRIDKKDLSQLAYSYVSLFGKSSLQDVKASIFQSARQISSDKNVEAKFDEQLTVNTKLLEKVPWVREAAEKAKGKVRSLGWLTGLARSTPFTDKYAGIIATLEYGLVSNYVICFDDLERKNAALSVREVMSLVDELARRKGCKVILIFNDNSFLEDRDKKEFEAYREKVVDAEIDFSPSASENLAHVVPRSNSVFPRLEVLSISLNLRNIRVLKKLKRLIAVFDPVLRDVDPLVVDEFLNHAAILCWAYYLRAEALPHEFIKSRLEESSWASYFRTKDDELTKEEKRYREITSAVPLSPSIFDQYIISYLERGFVDLNPLGPLVNEFAGKIEVQRARSELAAVWKVYTDTLTNNEKEIIERMTTVVSRNVDKLSVSDFSAAIEMLAELGNDVSSLVTAYIEQNRATLASLDRHDALVARRVSYKPLLDQIMAIQANQLPSDIDEVSMRIARNQGWNTGDVDFLASVSKADFIVWLRSEPADLPTKLRHGLLIFGECQGNPEQTKKYKEIFEKVRGAMLEVAASDRLNQMRLKQLYGIDSSQP